MHPASQHFLRKATGSTTAPFSTVDGKGRCCYAGGPAKLLLKHDASGITGMHGFSLDDQTEAEQELQGAPGKGTTVKVHLNASAGHV
ncbi:hypothetical protein CA264_09070 [Pontibacter actiniarum]|uniref:Uncharacterized protein n=1 Tax=Pontibacter actiniarum TaxID=323450 RepID=A0A1X9YRS7_9BACT|nr:hypothetical protein CA264_09070 [Pontibacter actiniarum]